MRRFFYNANLNSYSDHSGSGAAYCPSESLNSTYKWTRLNDLALETTFALPDEVYHHWCRVLRAKAGDQSIMFDGLGGQSVIELQTIDKKTAVARVIAHNNIDNSPEYYSTIAIVMSRGDKMDYAIQKSTELGATAIQLLTSQYGEVRLKSNQLDKKLNHWQQVALSASEQCGLNRPTVVLSPLPIEAWLKGEVGKAHDSVRYLMDSDFYQSYLQEPALSLVLAVPSQEELLTIDADDAINRHFKIRADESHAFIPRFDVLIGAEGGLSNAEYQLARQANYLPWQLGNRILRTETAPVVALSTLLYMSSK